jgi:hypothetical protein
LTQLYNYTSCCSPNYGVVRTYFYGKKYCPFRVIYIYLRLVLNVQFPSRRMQSMQTKGNDMMRITASTTTSRKSSNHQLNDTNRLVASRKGPLSGINFHLHVCIVCIAVSRTFADEKTYRWIAFDVMEIRHLN